MPLVSVAGQPVKLAHHRRLFYRATFYQPAQFWVSPFLGAVFQKNAQHQPVKSPSVRAAVAQTSAQIAPKFPAFAGRLEFLTNFLGNPYPILTLKNASNRLKFITLTTLTTFLP